MLDFQKAILAELRELGDRIEVLSENVERLRMHLDASQIGALGQKIDDLRARMEVGGAPPARTTRPQTREPEPRRAEEEPAGEAKREEENGQVIEWGHRGPDVTALEALAPPEQMTRKQVMLYIADIAAATRTQNVFSPDDPQIAMLAAVGPEHVDLLLEAATGAKAAMSYYAVEAVRLVAEEQHKEMVLDALPSERELAKVVLARGWAQDAREILLAELRRFPYYLPPEWIQAAASLEDPPTYGLLQEYLIHGGSRAVTHTAISKLPGIELTESVGTAWRIVKYQDEYDAREMAQIAIAYGHKDALAYLVQALQEGDQGQWTVRAICEAVARHSNAPATREGVIRWFWQNRNKLTFDAEDRMFRVPQTQATP